MHLRQRFGSGDDGPSSHLPARCPPFFPPPGARRAALSHSPPSWDNFHQLSQAADLFEQRKGPNGSRSNKTQKQINK